MDKVEINSNETDDEIEVDFRFIFELIREYQYVVLTGALILMLAVVG